MCKKEGKKKMEKTIIKPLTNGEPIKAKKTTNANKYYANKNNINLFDFMKKNGKSFPETDHEGNWIIDKDDSKRNRWLED